MRTLLPFAVALIPISIIGFNALWDFQIERYIYSWFNEPFTSLIYRILIIKLILHETLMAVFVIVPVIYLTTPNKNWKNTAFFILRAFFITYTLFNLSNLTFSLLITSPDWHNANGYFGIIRCLLNIIISIVLWKGAPQGNIPRIDLSGYPLFDILPRGERFIHHLADLLFLFAITDSWYTMLTTEMTYTTFALLVFSMLTVYFLYFFLSETFLGQTPGQSFTGSCVVGTNSKMSTRKALLRTLGRLIPLEALSFLWRGNWHDRISGTTVVRRDSWQDIPFGGER